MDPLFCSMLSSHSICLYLKVTTSWILNWFACSASMFVDMDESFGQKKDLHNVYKINLFTKMSFALEYCILSPDMKRIKRFVLKKKREKCFVSRRGHDNQPVWRASCKALHWGRGRVPHFGKVEPASCPVMSERVPHSWSVPMHRQEGSARKERNVVATRW